MAVAKPPTRVYMPPPLGQKRRGWRWHIVTQDSPKEKDGEMIVQTVCGIVVSADITLAAKELKNCHVRELCKNCFRAFELSEI